MDERAADEVVTSVINHLGHLAEQGRWFSGDGRLREAAIDETLRHAMLGDAVPSAPAQLAWSRSWSARLERTSRQPDPATLRAEPSHDATSKPTGVPPGRRGPVRHPAWENRDSSFKITHRQAHG
jgi:hypothetical protein